MSDRIGNLSRLHDRMFMMWREGKISVSEKGIEEVLQAIVAEPDISFMYEEKKQPCVMVVSLEDGIMTCSECGGKNQMTDPDLFGYCSCCGRPVDYLLDEDKV